MILMEETVSRYRENCVKKYRQKGERAAFLKENEAGIFRKTGKGKVGYAQ